MKILTIMKESLTTRDAPLVETYWDPRRKSEADINYGFRFC